MVKATRPILGQNYGFIEAGLTNTDTFTIGIQRKFLFSPIPIRLKQILQ